jgi:phosphoribosylaminoimidazole-succinocarboxamide synthase
VDVRKGKLLREGQTKRVYATDSDDLVLLSYKNEFPIGEKRELVRCKTVAKHAAAVSATVFRFLETYHIPTHFVDIVKPGELAVRRMDMIPILVWVWNCSSGNLGRRLGLGKAKVFDFPIVEYYYKNAGLHYPMIHFDHAAVLGLAGLSELQEIDRSARKINAVLKDFFARRSLKLVDLVLEFGMHRGVLRVGDDLGPESFRVWDVTKNGTLDTARFQPGKNDAERVVEEIFNRVELH